MALAALCGDDQWGDTWARVLQHRFAGEGEMRGHVVGNLLIVGLWELLGDHVDALDWVGRLLGAKGRVLPMALTPLEIRADVRGLDDDPAKLTTVRGQVEVATTDGVIAAIDLDPPDPPVSADAVKAIHDADWVVLGPGSWFTSVIPHLMVLALRDALVDHNGQRRGRAQPRGAGGRDAGLRRRSTTWRCWPSTPPSWPSTPSSPTATSVGAELDELREIVTAHGAELHVADVAADDGTPHHDPVKLAAAYATIFARVIDERGRIGPWR